MNSNDTALDWDADLSSSNGECDSFAGRLGAVLGEKSVASFARRCAVSEGLLRRYLAGHSQPGLDKLVATAAAAGVSLGWLGAGSSCEKNAAEFDPVSDLELQSFINLPVFYPSDGGERTRRDTYFNARIPQKLDRGGNLRLSQRPLWSWGIRWSQTSGKVTLCSLIERRLA
jgi:transcriptional regulator with XRE-family HTH domain